VADPLPLRIRFARPDGLPEPEELLGRFAVLDLAFDGRAPRTTLRWIRAAGPRLAAWIDHHEQEAWSEVDGDPRFVLAPRAQAPACPPLVTAERVARLGPADTLLCHGDLDGVLSGAKWMLLQQGLPCPDWVDPDSVAADSRVGELGPRGARLDSALRSGARGDRVRRAILRSVLAEGAGLPEPPEVALVLDEAAAEHERILVRTRRLAAGAERLGDLAEDVVLVELDGIRGPVDLTHLLLSLQREHDLVVVLARGRGGGRKVVVGTDPRRSGLDLRREFGVQGYAPFRVHAPEDALVERLPSARLLRALGRSGTG
jgi:hypothetical protein